METVTWLGFIGAFIAGFLVGWLTATVRLRGKVQLTLSPVDTPSLGNKSLVIKKVVGLMELKCNCGAAWKFYDASYPSAPGSLLYHWEDSYTCPNCGKATDIREIRKIQEETLAQINR